MAHLTNSDKKLQAQGQREQRRARLAAELRANLLRRREQARGRALRETAAGGEDMPPEAGGEVGRPEEAA
jgi:hypothetical protein